MGNAGVALLEAVVASAILSAALLAAAAMLGEAGFMEERSRRREAEALEMSRILVGMTLVSRIDLDRRLGVRDVRGYSVDVSRPVPRVYRIAVARGAEPGAGPALVTLVYRP